MGENSRRGAGVGQAAGDLRLRVQVSSIGFEGEYDGVWIEAGSVRKFIEELVALERNCSGSAGMESMSPGDLSFQLRIVDAAGHASAAESLGRRRLNPRGTVEARIGFDINVEPDRLPEILRNARHLLLEYPR
jgi:hypothetical protein